MRCNDVSPVVALIFLALLAVVPSVAPAQSGPAAGTPQIQGAGPDSSGLRLPPGVRLPDPSLERDVLLKRDSLDRAFPRGKPHVVSPWQETEMRTFKSLLKAEKYDVIIAPIGSNGYAVDRVSRSLIMRALSTELEARKLRVPNPAAMSRALGEGRRVIGFGEVTALAFELGVKRVVTASLEHDRLGNLTASVALHHLGPKAPNPITRALPTFSLGEGDHPSAVANVMTPAVMELLGLPKERAHAPLTRDSSIRVLPRTQAEAMATAPADIVGKAVALQVMATLAPLSPERVRERLFEQALVAAQALPRKHRYAKLFVARAWAHLEARETALRELGDSTTPEARAFREFLNGNLPDFFETVAAVKDETQRFLLEIDLKTLEAAYGDPVFGSRQAGQPTKFLDAFLNKYPAWAPLVRRRLDEHAPWKAGDLSLPKRLLDADLGLPGEKLNEQLEGMALTARPLGPDVATKLALNHAGRARREHRAVAACLATSVPCVAGAYVDLLEAVAISDVIRQLNMLIYWQGLPQQARAFADAFKPELQGHPSILVLESAARLALSEKMPVAQRKALLAETVQLAVAAAMLEQGQSKTSKEALRMMGVPSPESEPFLRAYGYDIPVRAYWYDPSTAQINNPRGPDPKMERLRLRQQLAASIMDLESLTSNFPLLRDAVGRPELHDMLQKRFKGHPHRTSLLQNLASSPEERRRLAEAHHLERPDEWGYYVTEAMRLIEEKGDYRAAAAMFDRFPGFSDPSRYNAVELGNFAYQAGNPFFWSGRFDETRRFYGIAAGLNNESEASLASRQRLAQLDGDYRTLLDFARRRSQRHNNPYGWRDFLAWLFVLGYGQQAWAGFDQLHNKLDNPQVWLAADVGLRLRGGTWDSHKRWLLSEPYKSSAALGTPHGLRLALMLNAIDRSPAPDLAATMRELAGPANTMVQPGGDELAFRPKGDGESFVPYRRSAFRAKSRTPILNLTFIESEFVYFADAYVELRRGNFRAAVERFDQMAAHYQIESSGDGVVSYALPYFAWASAKVGDPLGLETFIRALPDVPRGKFDRELALAFFSGLRGDHRSALRSLARALARRPYTERRPIFTEYQWAEACEWLHDATGQRAYLDLALDWARRYQAVQPFSAWAYAFEAKYGTDNERRLRATAIALYLDPGSERLRSVPADLRARAQKWFATNNPFKVQRPPTGQPSAEVTAPLATRAVQDRGS